MDSAFKSAPFAGYTTAELKARLENPEIDSTKALAMRAEIERRARVAEGHRPSMTDGERLRHATKS